MHYWFRNDGDNSMHRALIWRVVLKTSAGTIALPALISNSSHLLLQGHEILALSFAEYSYLEASVWCTPCLS